MTKCLALKTINVDVSDITNTLNMIYLSHEWVFFITFYNSLYHNNTLTFLKLWIFSQVYFLNIQLLL